MVSDIIYSQTDTDPVKDDIKISILTVSTHFNCESSSVHPIKAADSAPNLK